MIKIRYEEIKDIIEHWESRIVELEEKPDDYDNEDFKILFRDVFDTLIYLLGFFKRLPEDVIKILHGEESEIEKETLEEKQERIKEPNFYS